MDIGKREGEKAKQTNRGVTSGDAGATGQTNDVNFVAQVAQISEPSGEMIVAQSEVSGHNQGQTPI